jgi:hypothetical protein
MGKSGLRDNNRNLKLNESCSYKSEIPKPQIGLREYAEFW